MTFRSESNAWSLIHNNGVASRSQTHKVIFMKVGTIAELWRFPVKSMRGSPVDSAFVTAGGLEGDRMYSLRSSKSPKRFPYFTGRDFSELVLYVARFRAGSSGVSLAELEIETPGGEIYAADDPNFIRQLEARARRDHELRWILADAPQVDSSPVSLLSTGTVAQLAQEIGLGAAIDHRRFRANVVVEFERPTGFAEDNFTGKRVALGEEVVLSVIERDARCAMITIDPDTAERAPDVLRHVNAAHDGAVGVYADVSATGRVRVGDEVRVIG